MITPQDFYKVVSAVVPLYVAMILAYGSVRWWKILTPDQCGGINRFVAIFAVPLLSFQIIAHNDPYKMNMQFIAADALQKVAIILILGIWAKYSKNGSMEWMITLFMLGTLPNTLVMGIPLLAAMYGTTSGSLVVQAVVLQCIIWYTLLLFLYEYRSAKSLILEQFPKNAAAIVSFKVDSDVMSLDGRDPIQTDAEIGEDGKLHVTVRRSTSSRHSILSPRRSIGLNSMPSSKALTPRPSNLTGAEIYSIHSSRNLTPRESSFNPADFYSMMTSNTAPNPDPRQSNFTASDIYSLHSSRGPTPRTSNFTEENSKDMGKSASPRFATHSFYPSAGFGGRAHGSANLNAAGLKKLGDQKGGAKVDDDTKELHMFVWSSTGSPISDVFGSTEYVAGDASRPEFDKDVRLIVLPQTDEPNPHSGARDNARHNAAYEEDDRDDFSFGNRASSHGDDEKDGPNLTKNGSNSTAELNPKNRGDALHTELPGMRVMTKLILDMVWRKLIRNPNTYSSLVGLTWALISYRWHVKMPAIVENSILILSSAGLGMAMFSLGLFMALQKRILACGTSLAIFGMIVRFLTGPAVMAATSIAVGLRGVNLHVSIVQAALPQGIVPFVFAKEYNVHPDVLSTAVIFGMLVAFPITMLYYVLLGI